MAPSLSGHWASAQLGRAEVYLPFPRPADILMPHPSPVCRGGRSDIVFLVHGTQDSAFSAGAVRALLASTVSALGQLGPDATQVLAWLPP